MVLMKFGSNIELLGKFALKELNHGDKIDVWKFHSSILITDKNNVQ